MNKPCINYIERRRDGSLLIDYYNGKTYKHIFYGYSKRAALQTIRNLLNIKRNPSAIRDYTTTQSLEAWVKEPRIINFTPGTQPKPTKKPTWS